MRNAILILACFTAACQKTPGSDFIGNWGYVGQTVMTGEQKIQLMTIKQDKDRFSVVFSRDNVSGYSGTYQAHLDNYFGKPELCLEVGSDRCATRLTKTVEPDGRKAVEVGIYSFVEPK